MTKNGYAPLEGGMESRDQLFFCCPFRVADDIDSVRLYSTKSFKPLGTLQYHKVACQAAEFARSQWVDKGDEDDDEKEKARRSRWLVSGGKDQRPTVWELMDFSKKAMYSSI